MTQQDSCLQVLTTTASQEEARGIARALLQERLAACVQIVGPIESHYWWQGAMEEAAEWLCVIKTHPRLYNPVARCIRELHSYDTPEILAVPVAAADEGYLRWLQENLRGE